jgi:hypothetical protein
LVNSAVGHVVHYFQPATIDLLSELGCVHMQLWELEDLARSSVAKSSQIAEVKRRIDILNARRHILVDAIDAKVLRICPMPTVAYSETPGEISDRLLIITLKISANSAIAVDQLLPHRIQDDGSKREARLRSWRSHLQMCLSSLLNDIAEGRASLPPRAEFKLYNDNVLNPVLRLEHQKPS